MAGSQDAWRISGEERSKHDIQFFQLKPVNGFVTGTQARDFFIQSGLPTQVLGQIWTLADINGDGKMDKKEFSIAMHLIKKKLQGYELPKVLPASLKADPAPVIGSFAQPAVGGIPMSQPMGMGFPMGGIQTSMGMGMPVQPQASLGTATMTTGSLGLGPVMSNGVAGSFSHGSMTAVPLNTAVPLAAVPGSSVLQPGGNIWTMHPAAKLKHTQTFNMSDRNKRGFLLGVEARAILMQSGLPQPILAQIWSLSDIDRDGKLTCDEFCIAMHLSELARMGQVLPASLPQELVPSKAGPGSMTSIPPSTAVPGSQKDAFGDLLGNMGMPLPVPAAPAPQPVEDDEVVTFEDKRKENFDKGQAELERRRTILREQQQKEENERLEKERQEAEKRERQRQEVENRRQAELHRQLEKQREKEREIEEQRRKMVEQREAARRELDRQRQTEWEKQRKEQLVVEKEREAEQLRLIKSQMSILRDELETLEAKKAELALKVSQVQKGVTDFTTSIDAMRMTRDRTLADIDAFERQNMELNKTFSSLGGEKNALNVQVQTAQTTPLSNTFRTVANSVELKRASIQRLKKDLEKIESDTAVRLREIDGSNAELKNLKEQLAKLERDLPQLQKQPEDKMSPQKKVAQKMQQKQKIDTTSASTVPATNMAGSAQPSWFDFSSSDAIGSVAGGGTSSTVSWDTSFSGTSSSATHSSTPAAWGSGGTTTTGGSQNKQKYRAMYDFPAGRDDELTLVSGMEVWVFTDFTPVPGMEDWYKGEHEGKIGWFPKAYVERLDELSTDLFGGAFESLVQSSSIQKSETAGQNLFSSQISQPSAISSAPATSSIDASVPSNIPPEGLLSKAIYPWKARQDTDLTFDKDDIILVKEQQDMKWYGELNGKSGWFPKAYVKLTGVAPKSGNRPPVNSTAVNQAKTADTTTTVPPDTQGEYYYAMYTYTSDEPADLNFNEGDIICVTSATGDWWSGTIADQGKSGIFPANYVRKLETQPTKPKVSGPTVSSFDSLLGDFSSVFASSSVQPSSSMNLMDDFFATPPGKHGLKSGNDIDNVDALGINLDRAAESLTTEGGIAKSLGASHSTETNPVLSFSASSSFDELGLHELDSDKNTSRSSITTISAQPVKHLLGDFDQMASSESGIILLNDVVSLSWSPSSQFSPADATSKDKTDVALDFVRNISTEDNKSQLMIAENSFANSDAFGKVNTFDNRQSITDGSLINANKDTSATFGPSDGGTNDVNLDWGLNDFVKTSASQPVPSKVSKLDDFGLISGSDTTNISSGNKADQGQLFDIVDDFGFGSPTVSSESAKGTLKSSMSLPDILALENDAIQSDLLEAQNTVGIMHNIPISASQTSSVVQVDFGMKKHKIGSKPAPLPPTPKGFPSVVKGLFGRIKKTPEQKGAKKLEIAKVIAPYEATGTGQLSLEVGNLISVRQKSPRGWWEGELQVRGQKKKTGWFPANYVKILSSASARSTPEPTAALTLGAPGSRSATPQGVPSQGGVFSMNQPETVVALYSYMAQNDDELTFQKDDVITVLNRENPNWWSGQVNGQTGMFPSNYVTSSPQSQSYIRKNCVSYRGAPYVYRTMAHHTLHEAERVNEKWRRFNFFDKEAVKDPATDQVFDQLKDVNVSACTSGRGQLVVGDFEGNLYFINRQMELTAFRAYEIRVTHLLQMKQHNLLISIGEDEQGINPLIKVWNLDKMERGNPTCTRLTRAIPGNKPTPVSAFAVHENLNFMALGFENGVVVLFKGDVTRERHSKARNVYEGNKRVTGLAFKSQGKDVFLFVVTDNTTLSINITAKDTQTVLENAGANPGCIIMSDASQDNQLVIGRQDAVYFYQPDGRGPCLAFEGTKLQLHWFRGYLIIVGKESKAMPRAPVLGPHGMEMNTVTVYDIQNKFIAYSAPYPEVIDVMCESGSIFIFTGDRKLYQLQEKDTQSKLEMLFKKNNYSLAISLAKSQQLDQDGLIDIFTQYGDHLYSKGDYDSAIDQYIKTIGKLEASYVIRKFLDAQRIHNLTKYLQALHKSQAATEEHTTLLLNCYTKLKDVSKLDEFIMTKNREVDFDVETAINVCRQSGYCNHALALAEKHSKHEHYLKIQLEDIKDYQRALQYIGKLDFEAAESNLKQYGKILMNNVPQETTDLLKRLCTDYKPTDRPLIDQNSLEGGIQRIQKANAEEFIHIFVNNSSKLTEFLEHMVEVQPNSSNLVYNTLLELYLHDMVHESAIYSKVDRERKTLELLKNPDANYDIDQALILCQMNNFKAGILYLYEKAHLYQQILRYHMEHSEYVHVIEACKKFGQQDPQLWVQALSYFASKEDICKSQLMETLSHIDKKNLLQPLMVIQILAHNSTATLSVVKDYIVRRLQMENDQIAEDERLIKQYREDTQKKRAKIEELKTSAKVFQASKCNICSHSLELPSVHFLCEPHSYHQHCFESYAENDMECPVCAPENRKIMDIIRAQEQSRDIHEFFHNQLERAPDGFSVVADYFGRGVFNKVTLITDQPSKTGGTR